MIQIPPKRQNYEQTKREGEHLNKFSVKLIDFYHSYIEGGVNWIIEKSKLDYSSPEELRKENFTQKSDVWSVGILLFLLLCGETPFNHID